MKKRLLNETAVRKMMKLANIQTLTENFLEETEGLEETQDVTEEEVAEEGMGVYDRDDDIDAPDMDAPDMDAGAEDLPMDDEPVDDLAPEPAAEGGEVTVDNDDLIRDLLGVLQQHGFQAEVEGDAPVDDAPVDDAPLDDAPLDDAPVDDEPVMEEEAVTEETVDEDVVNEITRRVAQRILQASSE